MSSVDICQWLTSVNPVFTQYAEPLAEYGYENVTLLHDADEPDFLEALTELKVKKPHIKSLLKAFRALCSSDNVVVNPESRAALSRAQLARAALSLQTAWRGQLARKRMLEEMSKDERRFEASLRAQQEPRHTEYQSSSDDDLAASCALPDEQHGSEKIEMKECEGEKTSDETGGLGSAGKEEGAIITSGGDSGSSESHGKYIVKHVNASETTAWKGSTPENVAAVKDIFSGCEDNSISADGNRLVTNADETGRQMLREERFKEAQSSMEEDDEVMASQKRLGRRQLRVMLLGKVGDHDGTWRKEAPETDPYNFGVDTVIPMWLLLWEQQGQYKVCEDAFLIKNLNAMIGVNWRLDLRKMVLECIPICRTSTRQNPGTGKQETKHEAEYLRELLANLVEIMMENNGTFSHHKDVAAPKGCPLPFMHVGGNSSAHSRKHSVVAQKESKANKKAGKKKGKKVKVEGLNWELGRDDVVHRVERSLLGHGMALDMGAWKVLIYMIDFVGACVELAEHHYVKQDQLEAEAEARRNEIGFGASTDRHEDKAPDPIHQIMGDDPVASNLQMTMLEWPLSRLQAECCLAGLDMMGTWGELFNRLEDAEVVKPKRYFLPDVAHAPKPSFPAKAMVILHDYNSSFDMDFWRNQNAKAKRTGDGLRGKYRPVLPPPHPSSVLLLPDKPKNKTERVPKSKTPPVFAHFGRLCCTHEEVKKMEVALTAEAQIQDAEASFIATIAEAEGKTAAETTAMTKTISVPPAEVFSRVSAFRTSAVANTITGARCVWDVHKAFEEAAVVVDCLDPAPLDAFHARRVEQEAVLSYLDRLKNVDRTAAGQVPLGMTLFAQQAFLARGLPCAWHGFNPSDMVPVGDTAATRPLHLNCTENCMASRNPRYKTALKVMFAAKGLEHPEDEGQRAMAAQLASSRRGVNTARQLQEQHDKTPPGDKTPARQEFPGIAPQEMAKLCEERYQCSDLIGGAKNWFHPDAELHEGGLPVYGDPAGGGAGGGSDPELTQRVAARLHAMRKHRPALMDAYAAQLAQRRYAVAEVKKSAKDDPEESDEDEERIKCNTEFEYGGTYKQMVRHKDLHRIQMARAVHMPGRPTGCLSWSGWVGDDVWPHKDLVDATNTPDLYTRGLTAVEIVHAINVKLVQSIPVSIIVKASAIDASWDLDCEEGDLLDAALLSRTATSEHAECNAEAPNLERKQRAKKRREEEQALTEWEKEFRTAVLLDKTEELQVGQRWGDHSIYDVVVRMLKPWDEPTNLLAEQLVKRCVYTMLTVVVVCM
jgi:hypothetical protein